MIEIHRRRNNGSVVDRKVTVRFIESLHAQASNFVACQDVKPAVRCDTERNTIGDVADHFVPEQIPERGVLAEIVAAGVFPSRVAVPNNTAFGSVAVALDFDYQAFRIVTSGRLEGVVALAVASVGERTACVRIDGPRAATIHAERADGTDERFAYSAAAPDMRGPSFSWTISG